MKSVAVVSESNTCVWCDVSNVDVLVKIDNKLAFGMNLQT